MRRIGGGSALVADGYAVQGWTESATPETLPVIIDKAESTANFERSIQLFGGEEITIPPNGSKDFDEPVYAEYFDDRADLEVRVVVPVSHAHDI